MHDEYSDLAKADHARELDEAYDRGFTDALHTFAHMKDGVTYVGTCGATLKDATATRHSFFNYTPPSRLR